MKRWQRILGQLREVLPDRPAYRADVQYIYDRMAAHEKTLEEISTFDDSYDRFISPQDLARSALERR